MNQEKEYLKEEIRKEFQLERMVLFSDAVFAIAITLMAIEIKMPEERTTSQAEFLHLFVHLLPVIFAYMTSFFFISIIWYKHLQLFSLLKDYNRGLVVRNLVMLFFVGLFPFGASVISKGYIGTMIPIYLYMGIIFCCTGAQHFLYTYILVRHPELCIRTDMSSQLEELAKSKAAFNTFGILVALVVITAFIIPQEELKPMSALWLAVFPLLNKVFKKKEKKVKRVRK